MKHSIKYSALLLTVFFFLAISINAIDKREFSETAIENLVAGINSDNNGLMRSSIYFAGKYQVAEASKALVNKLNSEKEPSNIILIALALYQIGDRQGMMEVLDLAKTSQNERVQRRLFSIATEYMNQTNIHYVLR